MTFDTYARPAERGAERTNQLDVTVVLPCYNEQNHVVAELERITAAMDASPFSYELLVIDDKSTDNTLAVLRQAQERFPRMRLMPFRRNGGSGTARRIGTTEAHGRIVVWTDADMTYPNERIPEFVQYLVDRPDVDQVVGARTSEQGTYKFLRVPAKWTIRKVAEGLAGTRIRPQLGLRAFRRDVSAVPAPAAAPACTHDHDAFLSNQHPVTTCRSVRQAAGTSVPLHYAYRTSCRCCGWSCTSTRSRLMRCCPVRRAGRHRGRDPVRVPITTTRCCSSSPV
jgi:hypothetical protein